MTAGFTTRFAPSPTGPLHLGHAYSAMLAHDMARAAGGRFLLRIEDIDRQRSKPQWEAQILDDLAWLGLSWDAPPMRQSDRMPAYEAALDRLWKELNLFACTCTRHDIRAALSAPQEGVAIEGPDGLIYPGKCRPDRRRERSPAERGERRPTDVTLRLDMGMAAPAWDWRPLTYDETGIGPQGETGTITVTTHHLIREIGDVVLARREMGTSYHLSVVVDDAAQGVTHVVRGADLSGATAIHVVLQGLLQLPRPVYHHHRLIRDEAGKRLAKRDNARALAKYRAEGASPQDIRRMVGL